MKANLSFPLALLLSLALSPSHAATRSWTNTAGGNWFIPANWSPNGVPTVLDTANITNNGTYSVNIFTGTVAVASLNLGGASGAQTLINGTANNLNVTNAGTVRANGVLTVTNGGVEGQLTIQPGGQLHLTGAATKNVYRLNLINQGTVTWSGGTLQAGSTPSTVISNGGLWNVTGNNQIYQAFGGPALSWLNTGTLRKSAGGGLSQINDFNFVNQPSGVIQVDTGTLQLPSPVTNSAGTLRLNGGTLQGGGTYAINGGTLEGAGAFGANAIAGGIVSPGQAGPGLMGFRSGLNFGAGATLILSGTGSIPGTQYDQLSVTGAVNLANATLQVAALPAVAPGTIFTLILNDGVDSVNGTFNGLPENAVVSVGAQPFRIHYAGGSGNDVTLVRDSGSIVLGPQLNPGGYANGTFQLLGTGSNGMIYTIQATTNFVQWTNIGFATGGVSGNFTFNDTNAFRYRYRFYRTTE